MEMLRCKIIPETAFGSRLRGDTLFGQLCWAIRHRRGERFLEELLEGYGSHPFAVSSDGFPHGFLPRPALPLHRYNPVADADRKRIKGRRWLPLDCAERPVSDWLAHCIADDEVNRQANRPKDVTSATGDGLSVQPWEQQAVQSHNSINRLIECTDGAEFAPYQQEQLWHAPGMAIDLWIGVEGDRVDRDVVERAVRDVGLWGYGRDASIGLGKFSVSSIEPRDLPHQEGADTWLTLAPCAPQGLGLVQADSYYTPFTRFGRHGAEAVLEQTPFKNPILLADTGALLVPAEAPSGARCGQGLGGNGEISQGLPGTVHQGFAPAMRVRRTWGERS